MYNGPLLKRILDIGGRGTAWRTMEGSFARVEDNEFYPSENGYCKLF